VTVVEEVIASSQSGGNYTLVNVDDDGWGELVRITDIAPSGNGNAVEVEDAIAPTTPVEIELEAAEALEDEETPQTVMPESTQTSTEVAEATQDFRKGGRVITPKGEGEVLYFNEAWGEYNIAFDTFTNYFKPCEIKRCPLPNSGKREG
jgi:hypothetical protein